jgi:hypothetical protein
MESVLDLYQVVGDVVWRLTLVGVGVFALLVLVVWYLHDILKELRKR